MHEHHGCTPENKQKFFQLNKLVGGYLKKLKIPVLLMRFNRTISEYTEVAKEPRSTSDTKIEDGDNDSRRISKSQII